MALLEKRKGRETDGCDTRLSLSWENGRGVVPVALLCALLSSSLVSSSKATVAYGVGCDGMTFRVLLDGCVYYSQACG